MLLWFIHLNRAFNLTEGLMLACLANWARQWFSLQSNSGQGGGWSKCNTWDFFFAEDSARPLPSIYQGCVWDGAAWVVEGGQWSTLTWGAGRDAPDLGNFPRMQRTLNFLSLVESRSVKFKDLEFRWRALEASPAHSIGVDTKVPKGFKEAFPRGRAS